MSELGSEAPTRPRGENATSSAPAARGDNSVVSRIRAAVFDTVSTATTVGRYYLLEEVGRGGLGIVYAAFDPQLDRRVALKVVRPDLASVDHHARLLKEARALARLTHPNVVSVHDAGVHGQSFFVAMELVLGETLTAWTRKHAPDWQRYRDVLVQAGRGLEAAHRAGLVHRDFKPSNVLVDTEGRVRVVDFGLARAAATEPAQGGDVIALVDGLATQSGWVMGTPAYMAPEQFGGHTSPASDQWSFCVTAFEMFYGRRPFVAASVAELRPLLESGAITEPRDATSVPGWMLRVLKRGLSVDPRNRFPSMRELLAAMQADRTRSHRRLWALAALVAVLGVAGVAASLGDDEPDSTASIAALETDARAAADIGAFIYPPVDDPTQTTAYTAVIALENLDDDARARAGALRSEFADRLASIGDTYWEVDGGRGFASDFYAAALLFDPSREELRERTAITLGELVELRRRAEAGEFTPAELQGGAVLGALAEPEPEARGARLAGLGRDESAVPASMRANVERVLGGRAERRSPPTKRSASAAAEPPRQAASEAASKTATIEPPRRDPARARREVTEGRSHLRAGKFGAAEIAFHRALEADARNHEALSGLSEVYFNRGAHQKALSYAQRAVAAAPRSAHYRVQLGDAYFKVLRYDDARREYEVAMRRGHPQAKRALARLRERTGR